MIKTVGDLRKALEVLPDHAKLVVQWAGNDKEIRTGPIGRIMVSDWQVVGDGEYITGEIKKEIQESLPGQYDFRRLKKLVVRIDPSW
ncbi:hypothetical protein A3A38_02420 [Candidatus Kaiserbacteria bacterium RIFCSPLOWO2_01_FULL_53_17]|uniref:Uncharacterized protein n=1 Tax=Candidatus Kaiserbacteria bacterium RIFCSPLOWO2_01_FULL_53_17 TaxID=1798511 RepID=A0A1F6EHV3_9BACT|nr:MAG: hypothetical protein A3A38_02420 [Candidatus Kaiserbacteria bacterium RIFCSPLOWO2_01_FULL_53_17]